MPTPTLSKFNSNTSLPNSPPAMVTKFSSSSVAAATNVTTGLDQCLDNLKMFQLIWFTFTDHIARALVWCNVHTL